MINRRIPNIIVPLDMKGYKALFTNHEDEMNYLVFPICRDDLNILFENNFFSNLNKEFNLLIDEYEEEEIMDMTKINDLINFLRQQSYSNKICEYYSENLIIFLKRALKYKTGILFFF